MGKFAFTKGIFGLSEPAQSHRPLRKPAALVYGSDEIPPTAITIVSAIQHVGVVAIFMIYPLIIARHVCGCIA